MATRFIESSFRQQIIPGADSDRIPLNVSELMAPAVATGWTEGGTIIDDLKQQPPLGQTWSFLGWSIVLTPLVLYNGGAGATGPDIIGQLGRIIAGLTFTRPTPTLHDVPGAGGVFFEQPWHEPMIPLPPNTFGLDTLWDGRQDTAPPTSTGGIMLPPEVHIPAMYSAAFGLQQIVHNYALPVPVEVSPGQTMQMGLWITPSNARNFALSVTGAAYNVVVDDGQPQVTTWGRDLATSLAH